MKRISKEEFILRVDFLKPILPSRYSKFFFEKIDSQSIVTQLGVNKKDLHNVICLNTNNLLILQELENIFLTEAQKAELKNLIESEIALIKK